MLYEYFKEEDNKQVIANDRGFLAYRFVDKEMFVTDLFVKPEFRKQGVALQLAKDAENLAKERGCSYMTCNVFTHVHNREKAAEKIRLYSKFGFTILSAHNNVIVMVKEI